MPREVKIVKKLFLLNMLKKLWYYSYSLYFCLRYLPFNQAIKVPILVWPTTKIRLLHRGDIVLTGRVLTIYHIGSMILTWQIGDVFPELRYCLVLKAL